MPGPAHCFGSRASRSPHGERGLKYVVKQAHGNPPRSLSSWRAWIEMSDDALQAGVVVGSLSSWRAWIEIIGYCLTFGSNDGSLSSWRAWIEINTTYSWATPTLSLSSWRAWIEIYNGCYGVLRVAGRSPHGERGLKFPPVGEPVRQ